ncbi:MFS transporter [bacterium]|nr:MFS transporter [bacterium]
MIHYQNLTRSLRHPNYRLFFFGQVTSLIGSWLSLVATSWIVYRIARDTGLGNAAASLGTLIFLQQIPVTFLAPFAGIWVDRLDRRKVLICTQTLFMITIFAFAFLDLSGHISLPWIYALSLVQGTLVACDLPARQAIVVELIEDRADLPNAIALNSSMVPIARLIGPSIAGFLIYHFGEGYCYLLDGFSYLAVIIAYVRMRIKPHTKPPKRSAKAEFWEVVSYSWKFQPIRASLLIVAITSGMFVCQSVFLPILADGVLGGGERALGFLWGASGAGALVGGAYLASRTSIIGIGNIMVLALWGLGCGMVGLGLFSSMALCLASLFLMGGGIVLVISSTNMGVQTLVPDGMRARLMALFNGAFMGLSPFWGMAVGHAGDSLGRGWTLCGFGALCFVTGLILYRKLEHLRTHARPVLAEKGIILPLPEI